jgi:hypothetical protein
VGGAGGSFAYGDSSTGIPFGLTKNLLTPDFTVVNQISPMVAKALSNS